MQQVLPEKSAYGRLSAQPVGNPTFGKIVGGNLDFDAVADGEANPVLAHLAGDVGKHFVVILLERHAKHRSGQHRGHCSFNFNALFGHNSSFVIHLEDKVRALIQNARRTWPST